ncbi:MAG: hypothetical protein COA77_04955 [Thaumarchaeota archaeon]|nr:MAG: hypothetical protein COA77_04955 [Nitrososphaerota archaeon]
MIVIQIKLRIQTKIYPHNRNQMIMTKQVDILEKYGEMINMIPDIVCLTNKDHIITHCNERLLEQLGIERKEIIGITGMNFLTKESQEK